MNPPWSTEELCALAAVAACQAYEVLAEMTEVAWLVTRTGMELPAATRRELETELHASVLALHTVQLGVCEPRRDAR